ncbi:MAG: ATP-binding protein [Chloroflexi bacterium]|nr:ATP-binding protein [Chloroflexota bacterium]
MSSPGGALGAREEELFVGRERELALFARWLAAETDTPELLNVSGHGGIGKSAPLRAFARTAHRTGRPAVLVDGHDVPHSPDGLLQAPADEGSGDALARLNAARPRILLDTFEELGELTRYLQQELLPRLDAGVRVVVAGRSPLGLAWTHDSPWQRLVRPMPLDAFSAQESREYLRRRGLSAALLVDESGRRGRRQPARPQPGRGPGAPVGRARLHRRARVAPGGTDARRAPAAGDPGPSPARPAGGVGDPASRATFFRLLKRGVRALAEILH